MSRSHLLMLPLLLSACNSSEPAESKVRIISSTPASEIALTATELKPFWQVFIDKNRIVLIGAASPKGKGSIEVPLVEPTVHGSGKWWTFDADGQSVTIATSRVACVRSDGFRFPVTVHVTVRDRQLTGCGETGADL